MSIQPWLHHLHGALFKIPLSRLETIHTCRLRCITRDTIGSSDSIFSKDLTEKTHKLPIIIIIMIKDMQLIVLTIVLSNDLLLLDVTGQRPISQLLSRHRVRWLGHAARKPETAIVNQLLHADSIPGRPRPVGRPHYTWKDGAMQDLNALGPRLQLDLLRDWPKLALDRELWRGVASRC